MARRFLLDTHVVVRWLSEPKRLSPDQSRVLRAAVQRAEPVAVSDITLLEIANLFTRGKPRIEANIERFFGELTGNRLIEILPLTVEIATEVPLLTGLSDPADRAIVATARVHGLRLLTSDQRILAAHLVPTIE